MALDQPETPASYITMRYLKCECNELFFSEEAIQEHFVITSHRNIVSDLRTYQCNICTKTTETKQALLSHHYMLHRNNHKAFNAQRLHVKERGTAGSSSKDCRYCGKTLKSVSSRYLHERIHTGHKPYKCKYCDRAFINKPNLLTHQYTHTGERPYGCNLCVMAFRSLSNLNRHKRVFTIKEGVQYRIRIDFIVQREIVHGLKYVQKTYRLGVPVDKMTHMVGSYPPKTEIQSYTTPPEDAPSGMMARGSYSVNSLFTDDDKNIHLQWEWCFDIKKDWKD